MKGSSDPMPTLLINKLGPTAVKRPALSLPRGVPGGSAVKNPPAKQETQGSTAGQEDPLENPIFLPEKSHGQGSLVGYNPWGHRVRHDLASKQQAYLENTRAGAFE